jgi:protein-L-isoaspartate(D-aspartate) O-methyltransferase
MSFEMGTGLIQVALSIASWGSKKGPSQIRLRKFRFFNRPLEIASPDESPSRLLLRWTPQWCSAVIDFETARKRMVDYQIAGRGVTDELVLAAMRTVPRHRFIPDDMLDRAYDDGPLPIGEKQTISQPYIVARMTELLGLQGGEKVLDVGTGSGYQAAILAEIAGEVHSIERIKSLLREAAIVLAGLGYGNIRLHEGDGSLGLPDEAPFDGILVAAAADSIPKALKLQLSPDGGRLVIPIGGDYWQNLMLIERSGNRFISSNEGEVRFVPLIGE